MVLDVRPPSLLHAMTGDDRFKIGDRISQLKIYDYSDGQTKLVPVQHVTRIKSKNKENEKI